MKKINKFNGKTIVIHSNNSPNTSLFGPQFIDEHNRRSHSKTRQNISPDLVSNHGGPLGRYGARNTRNQCQMAQVLF